MYLFRQLIAFSCDIFENDFELGSIVLCPSCDEREMELGEEAWFPEYLPAEILVFLDTVKNSHTKSP